jgi:hypothetical protein
MAKQSNLRQLVEGVVEGFLATDRTFSVHEITTSIREVVNAGLVEIPSLAVSNEAFKYDISHEEVRYYFNELFLGNQFSKPLTRSFNGTYFEYSAQKAPVTTLRPKTLNFANNPVAKMGTALGSLASALHSMRNASVIAVPSAASTVQQAAAGKLGRTEVISRVRQYLTSCKQRGMTPTNKQIQSAIKRNGKSTGWTRGDLDKIRVGINSGSI